MRNRLLYVTLKDFVEASATQLASDAANGAEIPFEIVETPGSRSRTSLYSYRPLTTDFIRSRLTAIGHLPAYETAARQLDELESTRAYLATRGERHVADTTRERADAVLRLFLDACFAEMSEFEFPAERFERAYTELEAALYEGRALFTVVVPVHGLELDSADVPIGEGLTLIRASSVPDPPDLVVHGGADPLLAMVTVEGAPTDVPPVPVARRRFRALLSALRLYEQGSFALGPAGWTRVDAGPWQLVALGGSGRSRQTLSLRAEDDDELRAFCNLIARRAPRRGEIAWALGRYEMGCERALALEGLSDHLLALRALLEPEGPSSGQLAQRLALICALPEERAQLAERVAHAISLERAVIAGLAPAARDAEAIAAELAGHLRALLRDVLCGHLDADLVSVADGLLAAELDEPDYALA